MPIVPMLPALRDNLEGFERLQRPGWNPVDFNRLQGLANNLKGADRPGSADAIPDVWARPLLFHDRLTTGDAEACDAFLGFLAFLALRQKLGYEVAVVGVELPENQPPENAQRANSRIDRVLGALAPGQVALQGASWRQLHLFKVRNRVIGITSPLTLVFPASGINWPTSEPPSWWDRQREQFGNPLSGQLAPEYETAFRCWL